jgi:ribosomal protein S18 acetylase RimI-like enzyme
MIDMTDPVVGVDAVSQAVVFGRDAFDSDYLGLEIGRIHEVHAAGTHQYRALFDRLLAAAAADGYDQVLRRTSAGNVQEIWALEGTGFELMDVGVTFRQRVMTDRRVEMSAADFRIDLSTDDAVDTLAEEMVRQPWGGRYEADPAYEVERVRELRRQWLINSHRGRAQAFFVGWLDGRPAGYVTCLVDEDRRSGEIELVGTLPRYRGRGVAPRLIDHALAWFSGRVNTVSVRTQATNQTAAALYERAGFRFHQSDLTLRAGALASRRRS